MVSGEAIKQSRARRMLTPGLTPLGARDAAGGPLALPGPGGITLSLRPERSPAMPSDDDRRRAQRTYLRFTEVGIQFAATIFLLTLLGMWLDGRLGTTPLFTIVLLLLGFVGATWNLVRTVLRPDRPQDKPDKLS